MRKSNERSSLLLQALTKFTLGLLLVAALLFLPAGSFSFRQAWLLLAILFIPMFAAGLVMLRKSPELLKKRLNAKEKLLRDELPGYADYMARVKYRLIPYLW